MSAKILPFKKRGGMTRREFEKWKDEFEPFESFDFRDPSCYEKVQKELFSAFDDLGLGVDRLCKEGG